MLSVVLFMSDKKRYSRGRKGPQKDEINNESNRVSSV